MLAKYVNRNHYLSLSYSAGDLPLSIYFSLILGSGDGADYERLRTLRAVYYTMTFATIV